MLQFTKEEVERAIADHLVHSDRRDIAQISGLGESLVKRQLNPDDDVPSSIFVALKIICALDEKDPERGEAVWQEIVGFRELSKPRDAQNLCLHKATGDLNKEVSEYVTAKVANKPFEEQLKEFLDIEAALAKVKQALLDEHNRLKDTPRSMHAVKLTAV